MGDTFPPPMPLLDIRTREEILAEMKMLSVVYQPEWIPERGEPGTALAEAFCGLVETMGKHLNRVPQKQWLSFLNLLDERLIPPRAAKVPVKFSLAPKAPEETVVSKGYQVSFPATEDTPEVLFETTRSMRVSRGNLVAVISIDPGSDAVYDHSPALAAGNPFRLFVPLDTPSTQEHHLYLGDDELFNFGPCRKPDSCTATFCLANLEGTTLEGEWEGAILDENGDIKWVSIFSQIPEEPRESMGDQGLENDIKPSWWRFYRRDRYYLPGIVINGITSRWIRFVLRNHPRKDLVITDLAVKADYRSSFDAAFFNTSPCNIEMLDEDNPIQPFGPLPQPQDTFSIACKECFSKPGAKVTINFTLSQAGTQGGIPKKDRPNLEEQILSNMDQLQKKVEQLIEQVHTTLSSDKKTHKKSKDTKKGDEPATIESHEEKKVENEEEAHNEGASRGLELTWEYWDGDIWTPLTLERPDKTHEIPFKFTALQGSIQFTCPDDFPPCEVNGLENYWIRVRITGGDYGRPIYTLDGTQDNSSVMPPVLKGMSVRASITRSPQHCLTFNNLQFASQSTRPGKSFFPFPPMEYQRKTIFLGFDSPLVEGPLSLYFYMERSVTIPAPNPFIRWMFWSGKSGSWINLPMEDETQSLLNSGSMRFFAPPDLSETALFGRRLWWIKGVLQNNGDANRESGVARVRRVFFNTDLLVEGETVDRERLGSAEGRPNQSFQLANSPVLEAEIWVDEINSLPEEEKDRALALEDGYATIERDSHGQAVHIWIKWECIDRLCLAGPDRVFELDAPTGNILFGNGKAGRIPPVGRDNIIATYRWGGGIKGNVPAYTACKAITSLPFIKSVVNPLEAGGGSDAETIPELLVRAPMRLQHRGRATTASDFEALVRNADPSVAMVRCLDAADETGNRAPGYVTIIVVPWPQGNDPRPKPSALLRQFITDYINERASTLVASMERLAVCGPDYFLVSVKAELVAGLDRLVTMKDDAVASLEAFLHPVTGGPDKRGWVFGQEVCLGDIYHHLEGLPGLDHVNSLELSVHDEEENPINIFGENKESIILPGNSLPSSGSHDITARALETLPDIPREVKG